MLLGDRAAALLWEAACGSRSAAGTHRWLCFPLLAHPGNGALSCVLSSPSCRSGFRDVHVGRSDSDTFRESL